MTPSLRMRLSRLPDRLRWVLVVPVAFGAWFATLIACLVVHSLVGEPLSSEPTSRTLFVPDEAFFPACAALFAVAVVTAAALTAPTHRRVVAWVSWVVGTGVALSFLTEDDGEMAAMVAAAVVGGALAAAYWTVRPGCGRAPLA